MARSQGRVSASLARPRRARSRRLIGAVRRRVAGCRSPRRDDRVVFRAQDASTPAPMMADVPRSKAPTSARRRAGSCVDHVGSRETRPSTSAPRASGTAIVSGGRRGSCNTVGAASTASRRQSPSVYDARVQAPDGRCRPWCRMISLQPSPASGTRADRPREATADHRPVRRTGIAIDRRAFGQARLLAPADRHLGMTYTVEVRRRPAMGSELDLGAVSDAQLGRVLDRRTASAASSRTRCHRSRGNVDPDRRPRHHVMDGSIARGSNAKTLSGRRIQISTRATRLVTVRDETSTRLRRAGRGRVAEPYAIHVADRNADRQHLDFAVSLNGSPEADARST